MLQRAASNACSWWWASHIRTKQSKWLEQSLQDMEEKVQSMLKLIAEEGDSFAKRAEMYYKRRPELINAVEEAYRSFRSLADRYDMVSKELQNANHTIATVFPEQVQFPMDEEDDCTLTPKLPKINNPQIQNTTSPANIPKIPKAPMDDLKSLISTATKKFKVNKSTKPQKTKVKPVAKSGLTKDEAFREIDKLQKEILTLQTVKEFVKSSYESGVAKYWDIENQITEVQDKICKLQDEFDVDTFIEDNEARTLMAEAALKSCQETLSRLQEKQEKSSGEAREEQRKIEEARQLLKSLKIEFLKKNGEDYDGDEGDEVKSEACDLVQQSKDNERSETTLDLGSLSGSLTVSELAEKIDELVNKVISLESAISPQTVLIDTLRTETDDLHAQIRKLKNEKESLSCGQHDLKEKLREMEEKLNELIAMNKNVESQNKNLQTDFAQARLSLDHLSEKLSTVKPDEDIDEVDCNGKSPNDHRKDIPKSEKEPIGVKEVDLSDIPISEIKQEEEIRKTNKRTVTFFDRKPKEEVSSVDSVKTEAGGESLKEEELNLQKLLLNGSEDREKILLKEYTAILRNYKDVKKKLNDTEKKEQDSQFDATVQMRELKKTILKRDQEIQTLRERLNALQGNNAENEDANVISDSDTALKLNSGSDHLDMNEIKLDLVERNQSLSPVEQKLRTEIDSILDENLDFWLRFSTAFHQVQKFKSEVQDLQDEISNLKDKKKQEGSVTNQMRSEVRPIYKHLREIETELTVWVEQSDLLKDELKGRFASLCEIQEEIVRALNEGVEEDDILFSSHQAAKLQGEILNMKQENNKVRDELQAGLDHAIVLQVDITKTLSKLNEEFGIASDQSQLQKATSRPKVPLRSFIFGTKPRKQKQSIFSFIQPNRMYQAVRAGVPLSGQ